MTAIPVHVCLLTNPHEEHDWVYTSSGGGHMMDTWDDSGLERNQKWWHCPGIEVKREVEPAKPKPKKQSMSELQQAEIEELIMEVLIARWRLGENLWPFNQNKAIKQALDALEAKGWIWYKGGIVEGTYNVFLETSGVAANASPTYTPSNPRRSE